jgi:23S rRNA (pseudouridine1915-N3)-methyltransferase
VDVRRGLKPLPRRADHHRRVEGALPGFLCITSEPQRRCFIGVGEKFAALIADKRDHSSKDLTFVVGNYWGLSNQVKKRANKILSLSQMTLNHEMARLVLLEQIYRAFTLIHRIPYHK